jgi:hypothetical protein
MRRAGALMVLLLAIPVAGAANPPAFSLTLSGPTYFTPETSESFGGALTVASTLGVPLRPVVLLVDGAPAGSAVTMMDGTYSVSVSLPNATSHVLQAVSDQGTPLETTSATVTVLRRPRLIINEVDYDQPGTDSNEFVEIYNPLSTPVDLSGVVLVLVNGGGGVPVEYPPRTTLSGVLPGFGYAVVKAATVPAPPDALTFPLGLANSIQNGAPDALALFFLPENTVLDALSYEGAITAATISGAPGTYNLVEGTPTAAIDDGNVTGSLARLPNGTDTNNAASDWAFSFVLTPGAPNA